MLQALLFLLPAIAVFVPLLARRYPGERVVLQLRRRAARRARRAPQATIPVRPCRSLPRAAIRGGLLMGRSLAVRPPPLAALAG